MGSARLWRPGRCGSGAYPTVEVSGPSQRFGLRNTILRPSKVFRDEPTTLFEGRSSRPSDCNHFRAAELSRNLEVTNGEPANAGMSQLVADSFISSCEEPRGPTLAIVPFSPVLMCNLSGSLRSASEQRSKAAQARKVVGIEELEMNMPQANWRVPFMRLISLSSEPYVVSIRFLAVATSFVELDRPAPTAMVCGI